MAEKVFSLFWIFSALLSWVKAGEKIDTKTEVAHS